MTKMPSILRSTSFCPSAIGHGGERRSLQIKELLKIIDLDCQDLDSSVSPKKVQRLCKGLITIPKYGLKTLPSRFTLSFLGHQRQVFEKNLSLINQAKVFIWEDTQNYILPLLARDHGLKVIAVPHNIESLVTGNFDPLTKAGLPNSLFIELNYLSQADIVFTISREEQWLLNLLGINSDYLPYYPPSQILENLINIRKKRIQEKPSRFLILGTAGNPPTLAGMIEQITWLEEISQHINLKIDIVGFGTEKLNKYCKSPDFQLHGSVSDEMLAGFLLNAKAIFIHQQTGAGALTRIPEMLVAGIPVIASNHAARSAYTYSGIYTYTNREELLNLLTLDFETPLQLNPPKREEKRFIDQIKSYF